MRYASGKSRIAEPIANIISNREKKDSQVVSLFCGSCAVETQLSNNFDVVICNDKQEYLISMLDGVQKGYELPEVITEQDYIHIKNHKDEDKVLTGFVGFGCSFAGKFFGGYARNEKGCNYALQSKRSLLKTIRNLKNTKFTNLDYRDVELPADCIVYADPPYKNTSTTGYGLKDKFNSDDFWNYMREISKNHHVYISELNAPDDFICVWEKPVIRNMNKKIKAVEKLFVHKNNI